MTFNRPAFTLLEVLMAIGIVVMAVSIIANLQLRSLNRLLSDRDQLEKIFCIKKAMYDYLAGPIKTQKKARVNLEDPKISVVTVVEGLDKKSSLASLQDRIKSVRSRGEWKSNRNKHDMTMITFVLKPLGSKKEEKK